MEVNEQAVGAMQAYLRLKRYILPSGIARAALQAAAPFLSALEPSAARELALAEAAQVAEDYVQYDVAAAIRSLPSPDHADAGKVHEYVQGYEFRADNGGGYTPTDGERTMIDDAIQGFIFDAGKDEEDGWKPGCDRLPTLQEAAFAAEVLNACNGHDLSVWSDDFLPNSDTEDGLRAIIAHSLLPSAPASEGAE